VKAGKRTIQFGRLKIPYSLTFSARKHLKISVFPDAFVDVDAPENRSIAEVERALKKRARWIIRQQAHFERFQPLPAPRRYVSGETHRYLGRQYRLRIRQGSSLEVKLVGRFLWVSIAPRSEPVLIATAVQSWYREHAGAVFERRLKVCYERAKQYDLPLPILRIRKMKTRWGSCGKNDTIILNPELIRLPTPCIDYVITHELCHLRVHNHNRDFYALLARCMPDWMSRRERLNLAAVQN
jgi:predicted metal-dependent hydrolase